MLLGRIQCKLQKEMDQICSWFSQEMAADNLVMAVRRITALLLVQALVIVHSVELYLKPLKVR